MRAFDYIVGLLLLAILVAVIAIGWQVGVKFGRQVAG